MLENNSLDNDENMSENIPVHFNKSQKGKYATCISCKEIVNKMYESACKDINPQKNMIRLNYILKLNPKHNKAFELREQLKDYAKKHGFPKRSSYYAFAKINQTFGKNLEKVEQLFLEAIDHKDHEESAIKDLAQIYSHQNKHQEALKLLEKHHSKISNIQSFDNLKITILNRAKSNDQLIELLEHKLEKETINKKLKIRFLNALGSAYFHKNNFQKAKDKFNKVRELDCENNFAWLNLAKTLIRQGNYNDAEKILNERKDRAITLRNLIILLRTSEQVKNIKPVLNFYKQIKQNLQENYLEKAQKRIPFEERKEMLIKINDFCKKKIKEIEDND